MEAPFFYLIPEDEFWIYFSKVMVEPLEVGLHRRRVLGNWFDVEAKPEKRCIYMSDLRVRFDVMWKQILKKDVFTWAISKCILIWWRSKTWKGCIYMSDFRVHFDLIWKQILRKDAFTWAISGRIQIWCRNKTWKRIHLHERFQVHFGLM